MSRIKKFTRSLFSGYLMLGANTFYTLASVPLVLHYLSKPEVGLWALVSQIGGYITLIDLGMSASVGRILIDHKDDRSNGAYGSVIKTGALVGCIQGILIIFLGVTLSLLVGSWLGVPRELQAKFTRLMAGQSVLLGISFSTRIFGNLLIAHQRLDVGNYSSAIFFFLNLAAMWLGFIGGLGLYSFLIGQAVMTFGVIIASIAGCVRLEFLPCGNEWGKMTAARFKELFKFGNDIFIYTLGSQLINASQTILLTRLLGLDTAAVWSICTRTYNMLTLIIFRIFDYSAPALGEMIVRGEKELLARRFKQLVVFSLAIAVAAGGMFALCNSAFIAVWSSHKIFWPPVNDLLLAAWLVICVNMRIHTGLVGQTKKFYFMRYIFFIEGLTFFGVTLLFYRFGGVTAMLSASIICTLSFSLPYGLFRTRKYFGLDWWELLAWHKSAFIFACWLVPVGALTWWLTHNLSAILRLVIDGAVFGLWTICAFLRYGLSRTLQMEMIRRSPTQIKAVLMRIALETK